MHRILPSLAAAVLACGTLLLAGCSSARISRSATPLTGNWSFTSSATPTQPAVVMNAGFAESSTGAVSAVAHLSGASCVRAGTGIALAGFVDGANHVALTSQPFDGTTLVLTGSLSMDGKALRDAAWKFSGGSCAMLASSTVTATSYAQINGVYTGNFVDAGNNQLPVTATLTQTTQPDANGQFHLSGSASFPNNPCFTQPIVTDSLVTGDQLSTTYTQGSASITATGTFNSDATQLTVDHWQVTGGLCDGDSGTGLLSEQ